MPDSTGQPTPEELIRQKLAQMLAQGKTPQPGQAPQGGTAPGAPVPGTGAAANAGNDPTKPAPPTITPVTPQGAPPTSAPAAAVQPKPYQTDEEWAKANPGATPPAPLDYKKPGLLSGLAHGLAYGAMEFGRPGEGARAESEWAKGIETRDMESKRGKQQYPATLHQAREKEEMGAADLAEKQATTAEVTKRTELMGTSPEPKTTREALEAQYRDQVTKGDSKAADVTLDMMTKLYPKDFKDADSQEMAKIPPQVLAEVGPKPVTPIWAEAGKPPTTYKSTAEAQAAWGAAIDQHAIDLAGKEEAAKAKAATENKAAPETNWQLQEDPSGKPVWVNPHTREVVPADGVQKSGTAVKTAATEDKKLEPFQNTLDKQSEAKEFAAQKTGPGDIGLILSMVEATRPKAGFRMTQTEWNMIQHSRSTLGDAQALLAKVETGQLLTDEQREQMLNVIGIAARMAQDRIEKLKQPAPAAQGGSVVPAAGALPPGWQ